MVLHGVAATFIPLIHAAAGDSAGGSGDGLKIAIVSTAGVVVSAAFAALAIIIPKWREAPTPPPPPPVDIEDDPLVKELRRQIAERDVGDEQRELIVSGQAAMIERLRSFCYQHGLDPINFRRMRPGQQRGDNVNPQG